MTWKSITSEEMEMCRLMRRWMEVARAWKYGAEWLPTDADISKSALLERLRNGLEPLDEPPPLGMSCPWYALVEDKGPHYVFDVHRGDGQRPLYPRDTISALQHQYKIVSERSEKDFTVRDDRTPETSYRFRLWYDADWKHPSGRIFGGWFMQNMVFCK